MCKCGFFRLNKHFPVNFCKLKLGQTDRNFRNELKFTFQTMGTRNLRCVWSYSRQHTLAETFDPFDHIPDNTQQQKPSIQQTDLHDHCLHNTDLQTVDWTVDEVYKQTAWHLETLEHKALSRCTRNKVSTTVFHVHSENLSARPKTSWFSGGLVEAGLVK